MKVIAKTETVMDTLNPHWQNNIPIIITNNVLSQLEEGSDKLEIEVFDYNNIGADSTMGITRSVDLSRWIKLLEAESTTTSKELNAKLATTVGRATPQLAELPPVADDERERLISEWGHPASHSHVWKNLIDPNLSTKGGKNIVGQINLDMTYVPIFDPEHLKVGSPEITTPIEPLTHETCLTGIVTITIHQAKDLATTNNASPSILFHLIGGGDGAGSGQQHLEITGTGPKTETIIDGQVCRTIYRTPARKRTNNPIYGSKFTIYIADITSANLKMDASDIRGSEKLGSATFSIKSILDADIQKGEDWVILKGVKSGKVQLSATFLPVPTDGASALTRSLPLGILRIHMIEAKGLWNAEASTFGKSDPYTKLTLANVNLGKTHVVDNSLDPMWNELFYGVVYSRREHLTFEVFDDNEMRLDVSLGKVDLLLSECLEGAGFDAIRKKKVFTTVKNVVKKKILVKTDSGKEIEKEVETEEEEQVEAEVIIVQGEDRDEDEKERQRLKELTRSDFLMYEKDGLIISKSPLKCDVWAPLYLAKSEEIIASESAEEDKNAAKAIAKGTVGAAKATFNIVNPLKLVKNVNTVLKGASELGAGFQGESKQKGKIHFSMEFFPIVHGDVNIPLIEKKPVGKAKTKKDVDALKAANEAKKLGLENEDEEFRTIVSNELITKEEDPLANRIAKTAEILKTYSSGVQYIKVHKAERLSAKSDVYFQIIRNDEELIFSSRSRSFTSTEWNAGSDVFIRDTAIDRISIEIREQSQKSKKDNDRILGAWEGSASSLVGLINEELPLTVKNNAGPGDLNCGSVFVSSSFVPVKVEISASEKAESMGVFHIEIISAKSLPPDVTGAYCLVIINDEKVLETKPQKKTSNPNFNESARIDITNRLRSTLKVKVRDHNIISKDITVGEVTIPLFSLPPGEVITQDYPLEGAKSGTLQMRLYFNPEKVIANRNDEQEEKSAMRKFGKGLTNSFVGHSSSTLIGSKRMSGSSEKISDIASRRTSSPLGIANNDSNGMLFVEGTPSLSASSSNDSLKVESAVERSLDALNAAHESSRRSIEPIRSSIIGELKKIGGQITINILGADNLKAVDAGGTSDPYIKICKTVMGQLRTIHKTSVVKKNNINPRWNHESCSFEIPSGPIQIVVKDQNTFGSSIDLGEAEFDVYDYVHKQVLIDSKVIPPPKGNISFDLNLPIGQGTVHISGELNLTDLNILGEVLKFENNEDHSKSTNDSDHERSGSFGFGKIRLGKKLAKE
ncbi:hypothetical protein HK096_001618 [Nowakowskiella sp. JEL0078]|nr:hypothetical protein HK096_001618 [Nowakowskiella sp. JEL0078]